ncbi:hypothetical protein SELMODRAFT_402564 [Selaginella moellendorffii]|uniref:Uncharacterized protein n=1 Tax=Selaginella moellendorffii TaxID=88036 RepID=D8QR31_SELML|nr:hypothetical protein SELMODRAFT_402564 [Selaginella moellendorffii]
MDIIRVKEQGDGGDESHQGSPKTSLSPEIVAPSHAADRPMVVYDSDGGGFEDHDSANFIMLQHEEVFALQDATTALEKAMLQPYRLACTHLRSSHILESTIDVGEPHAKAIKEVVRQIPGLVSHGCTIATLVIAAGEVLDENDRRLARGGLYEMDLKACMPHIWNALNQLRGCGGMHSYSGLAFWVKMIIPPAEFINCLIFDQDFGENFHSWIVDIIRDMSPKELSKFHHFAVDSSEFQLGEPILI